MALPWSWNSTICGKGYARLRRMLCSGLVDSCTNCKMLFAHLPLSLCFYLSSSFFCFCLLHTFGQFAYFVKQPQLQPAEGQSLDCISSWLDCFIYCVKLHFLVRCNLIVFDVHDSHNRITAACPNHMPTPFPLPLHFFPHLLSVCESIIC